MWLICKPLTGQQTNSQTRQTQTLNVNEVILIIWTWGQKCTRSQVSAVVHFHMIYSFGKVVDVYYPRLVGGDTGRTKKKVKSRVKSRLFSQLLVYYGCFLSGMWENICSSVRYSLFFFFFNLYLSREGLLRTQTLFSAWTEIHAAVNVPLSSQPGSKSVSDIYFCVIFLIITFKWLFMQMHNGSQSLFLLQYYIYTVGRPLI